METNGSPSRQQVDEARPTTEAEPSAAELPQAGTAPQGVQAGTTGQRVRDVTPDASLRRFAEQQFGKLDEPTARRLWADASRITAEHNPFGLTVAEGAGGLLERDPEQYWATLRVAQVLHDNEGAPDRIAQAVVAARDLADERAVGSARAGLLGGGRVLTRMADVVEAPAIRDAGAATVPRTDSPRISPAGLDGTSASSGEQIPDVPSVADPADAAAVAPIADPVADGSPALVANPGFRTLYADASYAPMAREFEKRLGTYASQQPSARDAVREGVSRLLDVLTQAHPDRSAEEIAAVFFADNVTSAGQIGAGTGLSGLHELLRQGRVRELMTAFHNAAIENESPLTLNPLLREIADSGDWAKAEHLGLDVQALREQAAGDLGLGAQGPELPKSSVSGTAARVGNAFKLLDVPGLDGEGLALALIGWMLPLQDHSLHEILAGLQTADVVPSLAGNPLDDAARMYRSVPGLSLAEVRQQAGEKGMLPHEAVYWSKFDTRPEDGGFTGLGGLGLELIEERRADFGRLVDQPLPPETEGEWWTERWLRRNGLTARQVLERLTPAHFASIAAYTASNYQLINPLFKSDADEARSALRRQIDWLIDEHVRFGSPLQAVLNYHPEIRRVTANPPGKVPGERARYRERLHAAVERVLPVIEQQMAAHAAMLVDALDQLPPATGEAWRGTRLVGHEATEISFNKFASFTRNKEEAEGQFLFASKVPIPDSHRVLIRAELTGNAARDISAFSLDMQEQEVLLLPTGRLDITSREMRDFRKKTYELVEAVEELPELPLGALRNALQHLAGSGSVVKRGDLLPLARRIGAADGLQVWHLGELASEVHGGPEHLTVERLTDVRRAADLARGVLQLSPDTQIVAAHLDTLVRRLDGAGAVTPVDEAARSRLVGIVSRLETPGQQVTYPRLAAEWRTAAAAQNRQGPLLEGQGSGGEMQVLPDLKRFAEQQFGKLDEPTARQLWTDASRITAEHNPFDLTVAEGRRSLLERDPEQYWATMRVAQVLHQNEGVPDRDAQAVATATAQAAERGVASARERLLGGVAARMAEVVEGPLVRDAGDAAVPQADSLRTFLARLDGTDASSAGQLSDVPSGDRGTGVGGLAPVTDLLPEGFSALGTDRGARALYADPAYTSMAREFEKRLGAYAFRQPSALGAVRQGVARLFDVLAQAHPDLSEQEIAKVFFASNLTSAGQIGADTGRSGLEELLEQGSVRELMTAFFNAAIENRSPVALKSLLREIADSGDWAKAERLGLDMQALRDQVAFLKSDLRVRLRAAVERV
ncbi:hypothetical protein ACWD4J_43930, partial [Streptomyces sp. NPDC002577]